MLQRPDGDPVVDLGGVRLGGKSRLLSVFFAYVLAKTSHAVGAHERDGAPAEAAARQARSRAGGVSLRRRGKGVGLRARRLVQFGERLVRGVQQPAEPRDVTRSHCLDRLRYAVAFIDDVRRPALQEGRERLFDALEAGGGEVRKTLDGKFLFEDGERVLRLLSALVVFAPRKAVRLVAVEQDEGIRPEFERDVFARHVLAVEQHGIAFFPARGGVLVHDAAVDARIFALGALGEESELDGIGLFARDGGEGGEGRDFDRRGGGEPAPEGDGAVLHHVAADERVSRLPPEEGAARLIVAVAERAVFFEAGKVERDLFFERRPGQADAVFAVGADADGVFERESRRQHLAAAVVDVFADEVDAPRRRNEKFL